MQQQYYGQMPQYQQMQMMQQPNGMYPQQYTYQQMPQSPQNFQ